MYVCGAVFLTRFRKCRKETVKPFASTLTDLSLSPPFCPLSPPLRASPPAILPFPVFPFHTLLEPNPTQPNPGHDRDSRGSSR